MLKIYIRILAQYIQHVIQKKPEEMNGDKGAETENCSGRGGPTTIVHDRGS